MLVVQCAIPSFLAVKELLNLIVLPVHDRHTGSAAAIPTSNNALRDVVVDEHSVHAREFLLRASIERVVDLRQHTHQRAGPDAWPPNVLTEHPLREPWTRRDEIALWAVPVMGTE